MARSGAEQADVVEGAAAADRLRHDERRDEAVRRRARPPGRQHGDQQGAHHPDHQRPRGPGQPAAAARRCPATTRTTRAIAYDVDEGQGAAGGGRLRRRLRDRALRLQHRSQPAHRPGDPAGPRRDRHQGGDQVARPGQRHRRRRHAEDRADDLVGRHGLDRRLPRSVRLLRADPRLRAARPRAAGTGRGTATRTARRRPPRPTP